MGMLFMIEFIVHTIALKVPPPKKSEIGVHVTFANFLDLEIRANLKDQTDNNLLQFDSGRSLVFAMNAIPLKEKMASIPVSIKVFGKNYTQLGAMSFPWNEDYKDMVGQCEYGGYISPVYTKEKYALKNEGAKVGEIELYVRVLYLGETINTAIQLIDEAPGLKQYLFKDQNNATTFLCQKFGAGSFTDMIAAAPLLANIDFEPIALDEQNLDQGLISFFNQSIVSLAGGMSVQSIAPSIFDVDISKMLMPMPSTSVDDDGKSLVGRQDNLFLNLQELFKECSSAWSAFSLAMGAISAATEGGPVGDDTGSRGAIDFNNLTIKDIERRLCKNPDCPAVKRFGEYGIGPLAKGRGLGGVYGKIDPPISYGYTAVSGLKDYYGAYGYLTDVKPPADEQSKTSSKCDYINKSPSACSENEDNIEDLMITNEDLTSTRIEN